MPRPESPAPVHSRRVRRPAPQANPPEGYRYVPEFLTAEEHDALLRAVDTLEFREIRMHGVAARRTAIHYGWDYRYDGGQLEPGPELPGFLLPLRDRAAALVHADPARFSQALVLRYPPGATMGWHRDAPMFGPVVVGVSLAAPARMRLRRAAGETWALYEQTLAPRSAYVLAGPARALWQHAVPAVDALRYSVTFRTLREDTP